MKYCNFILRRANHEDEHIHALFVEIAPNMDAGYHFTVNALSFEGHVCFLAFFEDVYEAFSYIETICEKYPEFEDERSCGIDDYKDWEVFKKADFE